MNNQTIRESQLGFKSFVDRHRVDANPVLAGHGGSYHDAGLGIRLVVFILWFFGTQNRQ
jgi:hypothetical protein